MSMTCRYLISGIVLVCGAAPIAAQTVADLYAQNCRTADQQAAEGCKALASSLPPVKAVPDPDSGSTGTTLAVWGPLADVVGGIWHSPGELYSFEWEKPDVLVRRSLLSGQETRFALDTQNRVTMIHDGGRNNQTLSPFSEPLERTGTGGLKLEKPLHYGDVSYNTVFAFERVGDTYREYYRISPGPEAPPAVFERLDQRQLAELRQKIAEVNTPSAIRSNWGITSQLVGKTWANSSFGTVNVEAYEWLEPGLSMIKTTAYVADNASIVIKPTRIVLAIDPLAGTRSDGAKVLPDGSIQMGDEAADSKVVYEIASGDKLKQHLFQKKNGTFRQTYSWTYSQQSGDANSAFDRYLARERADAGYSDGRNGNGGGFMAALTGAIMGAATGYAESGGSSVGAVAGAMGGAAVGKAGGNDALYQQMMETNARVTAEAETAQRRLERSIEQGFRQGGAAPSARSSEGASQISGGDRGGAITVASPEAPARSPQGTSPTSVAPSSGLASAPPAGASRTASEPQMCTTPGGSREWSTGGLTSLKDAQELYESEAAFQRSKGSSMGPMHPSGKVITVFGEPNANYVATITYPAKTFPCGSRVTGQ